MRVARGTLCACGKPATRSGRCTSCAASAANRTRKLAALEAARREFQHQAGAAARAGLEFRAAFDELVHARDAFREASQSMLRRIRSGEPAVDGPSPSEQLDVVVTRTARAEVRYEDACADLTQVSGRLAAAGDVLAGAAGRL